MTRLEKYVCATYICLAVVLGGVLGYFKFAVYDISKASAMQKDENENVSEAKENEINVPTGFVPIKAELTAYCNCAICSEQWGSQTAMQTHTRVGVVATPKEISLGSKLFIPDLKKFKEDCLFDVEDRGGAVKIKSDGTYIIDVWLPTHEQVKEFGRKKTIVYLLK
ncbi:3D domain-containing protein [Clostridium sp. YIM B02555]|uniref:3D domain-containing protein n=1 Tax=Clostridium sp. YIM B02555 TaxID=2911968 RepID=UPI001EEF60E0|nr:3D domain-containing protein [Clostridium sp. YIM B02555]